MRSDTHSELRPTLWRTCRALANHRRLQILELLFQRGETSVAAAASALRISRPVASQYLRALNARGLLTVRRDGRWVCYRVGANPGVSSAARLVEALQKDLRGTARSRQRIYRLLTGFTNPRRVAIVRCLSKRPLARQALASATGISRQALSRHLQKLCAKGIIEKRGEMYWRAHPNHPMGHTLAKLAASS